jgi:nucleotide-binding universal stress UspA family protein
MAERFRRQGDTMKILVAADGSSFTKRMLAYLAAHDEWLGSAHAYTVLHTVAAVPPRAASVLDKAGAEGLLRRREREGLQADPPVLPEAGHHGDLRVQGGPGADTIAAMADKGKFDLLMMGSHGHGTLTNLVMGSVATKVLANCATPVLLIR